MQLLLAMPMSLLQQRDGHQHKCMLCNYLWIKGIRSITINREANFSVQSVLWFEKKSAAESLDLNLRAIH
jgi:hypothetical protein